MRQSKRLARAYHVTLGLADSSYGGPEEGGWWFNTWEPVEYSVLRTKRYRQALRVCQALNAKLAVELNNDGRNRDISSVNCEGVYRFRITRGPALPEPKYIPRYC